MVALVRPWGVAKAKQILTQVQADYVAELNRSPASDSGRMYGVDSSSFMRQYDALWAARTSL